MEIGKKEFTAIIQSFALPRSEIKPFENGSLKFAAKKTDDLAAFRWLDDFAISS